MTTVTTDDSGRRGHGLFFWLLLGSVLVHGVLIVVIGPMLYSRMEFDRQEEIARDEQAKLREQQRRLAEAERRERLQLSESQARQLKETQQRRDAAVLQERLRQLDSIADEMQRLRDIEVSEIGERTTTDIVMARINQLRQMAEGVKHKADNVKDHSHRPELIDHLDDQADRLDARLDDLARSPEAYRLEATQLAEEARRQHDELSFQQEIETEGGQRHRMKKVKEALAEFEAAANDLAAGIEMSRANRAETLVGTSRPTVPFDAAPAELYQAAVDLEEAIQTDFAVTRAVDVARSQGTSLDDALASTNLNPPARPDLLPQLDMAAPETVADFDRYRDALEQAKRETTDMTTRAISLLSQAGGDTGRFASVGAPVHSSGGQYGMLVSQAARGRPQHVVDMTPLLPGGPGGYDAEGLREAEFDSGIRDPVEAMKTLVGPALHVNPDVAQRNALPGRAFTDASNRRGWLFIDTWYVIGPWENEGRLRHELSHPPEQVVDFDAVYTDGKFAADPNHPYHGLRWRFYQSDQIRCQPPKVFSDATYYAYTEISSDRDREVLLTISTDDAAKAWLNGQTVWEDVGLSPWILGEGFRRVPLKRGYNTLLVRIDNGPLHCVWSVLMCPTELAE